jgi:predicted house-cleaning noncanonical NTP pyrophosphatase (MazG superfamily)
MTEYNKLVRDKIPQIIQEAGKECSFRVASPRSQEYKVALRTKLVEEANEFYEDPSAEELADVLEVIAAIQRAENLSDTEVEDARTKKNCARGAFADGIILERVV